MYFLSSTQKAVDKEQKNNTRRCLKRDWNENILGKWKRREWKINESKSQQRNKPFC